MVHHGRRSIVGLRFQSIRGKTTPDRTPGDPTDHPETANQTWCPFKVVDADAVVYQDDGAGRRPLPHIWASICTASWEPRVICPYCDKDNDRVIDSRAAERGAVVRRRRECANCDRRFTTYERVERTARVMVVKKDGSRVPFDRHNVLKGLQAACGKRPVSEQTKIRIAHDVEDAVYREFDREVPSVEIGRHVSMRLREVDEIAYIRYASEHLDFRNLDDLVAEVTNLKSRPRNLPNQQVLFSE